MKTLIINGSPRKKGDCAALISKLEETLNGDVKRIDVYFDDINPCIDCRYCWNNEGCSIDDDMQSVYSALNEVDNLVIASPIFFSELTGELLNLVSRLQMIYAQKFIRKIKGYRLKKKHGALLLVGGGRRNTKTAEERTREIFMLTNVKSVGNAFSLNTDDISAADDVAALKKVEKIGNKLNDIADQMNSLQHES